jgi:hypothetical protein
MNSLSPSSTPVSDYLLMDYDLTLKVCLTSFLITAIHLNAIIAIIVGLSIMDGGMRYS